MYYACLSFKTAELLQKSSPLKPFPKYYKGPNQIIPYKMKQTPKTKTTNQPKSPKLNN